MKDRLEMIVVVLIIAGIYYIIWTWALVSQIMLTLLIGMIFYFRYHKQNGLKYIGALSISAFALCAIWAVPIISMIILSAILAVNIFLLAISCYAAAKIDHAYEADACYL